MQADRPAPGSVPEYESAAKPESQRPQSAGGPRVMHSAALLGGQSQLAILHNETVYFLRQTRFGKLILTK
jgi:hemin uptake protein HemP